MLLNMTAAPAQEPLELSDVEAQVRLPGQLTEEAEFVKGLISAVREMAESQTRRALVTQSWEIMLNGFPLGREAIELPMPPLQSVDSIEYVDVDNVVQTLNPVKYKFIGDLKNKGFVFPAFGETWPVAQDDFATVKIKFTCGYGPIAPSKELNIPTSILQWIKINVANLFENRETVVIENSRAVLMDTTPMLADGLLANHRLTRL